MNDVKDISAPRDLNARVRNDPNYAELERTRNTLAGILLISMLVIHFSFLFLVAFEKVLLSTKIYGAITLAFPVCLFDMLSTLSITGIYVVQANRRFDPLTRKIAEAAR